MSTLVTNRVVDPNLIGDQTVLTTLSSTDEFLVRKTTTNTLHKTTLRAVKGSPTRTFTDDALGRYIYIDSLLGNDATADGTPSLPFKTILAAATFYSKNVHPFGYAPIFQLVGTAASPRVYKGAQLYFNTSHSLFSGLTKRDNPTTTNFTEGTLVDRTLWIRGNPTEPQGVIIEGMFTKSRQTSTGQDLWISRGLYIEYQGGSIRIEGITFRYNAVNNLPGYPGNDQFYNLTTDFAAHLDIRSCYYALVNNCVLERMIDDTIYSVGGPYSNPDLPNQYMYGIGFYGVDVPRLGNITITGSMRYIVKVNISETALIFQGAITLQNNPAFFGYFEVEAGGGISITSAGVGYSLNFIGTPKAPRPAGNWYNYTFLNFDNALNFVTPGITYIQTPLQGSSPVPPWPTNTTYRGPFPVLNITNGYKIIPVNKASATPGTSHNL